MQRDLANEGRNFLSNAVLALVDTVPVLWQLVLRDLVLSLNRSPWAASNFQYFKSYVDFCVERKYWGKRVVRGKEKEDKRRQRKKKINVGVRGKQKEGKIVFARILEPR